MYPAPSAGKRVRASAGKRVQALVLLLISEARLFSQSQSAAMQNQSNHETAFNTQLKTVLYYHINLTISHHGITALLKRFDLIKAK